MRDLAPTEVQDWVQCPQYWSWWHRGGWKPRTVGKNEVQAWVGSAFHVGIEAWIKGQEDPIGSASAHFAVSTAEALAQGREIPVTEHKTPENIRPITEDALKSLRVNLPKFIEQAPAWLQTACRGVEVTLGHARLDWIGNLEHGHSGPLWRIVDFKTKRTKPRNLEAYQWELRRSWQFADYVERAATHPDSPAKGQVIEEMEVQTIILDKFEVIRDTFQPAPISESERLKVVMTMEGEVWKNRSKCRNWYGGDCPYLRACWDYERDPKRMTVDYIQFPTMKLEHT